MCILRALPETFNNDNVVFHIVTTFLKITVCYDSVSSIDRKRNRHRIIMLNHVKKRNEEARLYKARYGSLINLVLIFLVSHGLHAHVSS